jgi:hypothetical protein
MGEGTPSPDRNERPSFEARSRAAELQARAEKSGSDRTDLHRVIRATDGGWVEIQADYLAHLLDVIDQLEAGLAGG